MKWIIALLTVMLIGLQYRLWVGEGSFADIARLTREIHQQQAENSRMKERNRVLAIEVNELKSGLNSLEERARSDMGMVREGETFYLVVKEK